MASEPNTVTATTVPSESLAEYSQMLREKILFGLSIYPFLSPTMLHVFLGTSTSTHVWKPLLNDLIGEGKVARVEVPLTSPHDRTQTYTVLHLTANAYTPPESATPSAPQDTDASVS